MASNNEELANELNGLIEINNDRIEGYEKAKTETEDPDLKTLFTDMASRSHQFKDELSDELQRLGSAPTNGTTNSGKAFRVWMGLKTAVTGTDRKAVLESCETGEDAALETYKEALQSSVIALDAPTRVMIEKQRLTLQSDHARIKTLRDTVSV